MSVAPRAMALVRSRTYAGRAEHIAEARRFLSTLLDGSPVADDAVLCLSELATNAIVHSDSGTPDGHFSVFVQIHGDRLRVEVRDQGGPWTRPTSTRDGQHGRGLLIVAQLSSDWGRTGDRETGWMVWFEMVRPDDRPPGQPITSHHHGQFPITQDPHRRAPGDESAMTEPSPAGAAGLAQYDTHDMQAIQAGLASYGLTTHLTDSRAGLDLTASPRSSGKHDAEFWIDEDGYAELRYWYPPDTPPAQVTATALRILDAVTSTGPHADPSPGQPTSAPR
jgi:serine/threonine-protein kinase RsbW